VRRERLASWTEENVMTMLEQIAPAPALVEVDGIELAVPPARAWEILRNEDLGSSPLVRALFAVRTLPERLAGRNAFDASLRLDDLRSTLAHPGFQILAEQAGSEVVIGAIGKLWHLDIPFVHVADANAFRDFATPGFVKVAWAIRVAPLGDSDSRVTIEVRVDATDNDSWIRFRRYFAVIGPGSRFIRKSVLASLARRLGTPASREESRALTGDELLSDAAAQFTHGVTIAATPEAIWPWLLQMGTGRAGFYSIDALDNHLERSAREVHPELQQLKVGDVVPASPDTADGFEVLVIEPHRALVLGGLYDADAKVQREFSAPRKEHYWHATWAFVLEPLDASTTRLHVRARAAYPAAGRLYAEWIRPVHAMMQGAQLRHLAARVEGRLPRDDWRDVLDGVGGASIMTAAFLTSFLRGARNHWGVSEELAASTHPGDDLILAPRWSWTHGIEIDAAAEDVWPWIAQLGADRGGFYSYQWLENVMGCEVRNAEAIHPSWAVQKGDVLRLHPRMPPLQVVTVEPGRFFVAHGAADAKARAAGKPWAETTWTFLLEPLGPQRCRFVSRFRCASSDDVAMRSSMGPTLLEPIGFAMDRRMLLGVKTRAESAAAKRPLRRFRRKTAARAAPKER
jgi:hypothetical protein